MRFRRQVERQVRRAEPWLVPFARLGYIGKGLVFLSLGAYNLQADPRVCRARARLVPKRPGRLLLGRIALGHCLGVEL